MKSFDSAKWSAVYERLRRNPRELESITQDVRQDLSSWVRENIESSSDHSQYQESNYNHYHHQSSNPPALQNSSSAAEKGECDPSNEDVSGNLVDLLGSLAKHIATMGAKGNEEVPEERSTNATTEEQENSDKFPSSILGLLASLQSRFAADQQDATSEMKAEEGN